MLEIHLPVHSLVHNLNQDRVTIISSFENESDAVKAALRVLGDVLKQHMKNLSVACGLDAWLLYDKVDYGELLIALGYTSIDDALLRSPFSELFNDIFDPSEDKVIKIVHTDVLVSPEFVGRCIGKAVASSRSAVDDMIANASAAEYLEDLERDAGDM